jgi:hypothetical protein
MSTSVEVTSTQRKCRNYVDPFLETTKHSSGPKNADSKEWVNFGVRQTGQVNNANSDKEKGKQVLHLCEAENAAALKKAAERAKPWYKRIF